MSTPLPERPAGVSGRALRWGGAAFGRLVDGLHGQYRVALPGSSMLALYRRLAALAVHRPAAAAGAAATGWGLGYLGARAALPALVPAIRLLDLGGPYVGPHGLHYPLPAALPAAAALFGVGLVLAQRLWVPRVGPWPAGSLSIRVVTNLLFLTGPEDVTQPHPPPRRPRDADAAAAAGSWPYLAAVGLVLGLAAYVLPPARFLLSLAAVGGLYLAFVSTQWYLVAVCFALPFVGNEMLLAMLGVGVVSLAGRIVVSRGRPVSAANAAAGPLLAYGAVVVFATVSSVTVRGSLPDLAVQLAALAFVAAMLAVTDSAAVVGRFAAAAVAGLGIQSLIGLYQYAAGVPIEKAWVDLTHQPGLAVRVTGSFGNPNVFAEYLVLLLPLALGLLLCARSRLVRLGWLAACGLGAGALVLTFSRGGWVGLAAGVLGFAVIRDRRLLMLLLIGALVVAALPGGQSLIDRRLQSIIRPVDSSSAYRIVVWRETLGMIEDFWPSGVGLGHRAYMLMYPRYMLDRTKRPFHSHSTYLQILAETGLPGLIALLWVMWRVVRTGFASLRKLGVGRAAGGQLGAGTGAGAAAAAGVGAGAGAGAGSQMLAPLIAGGLAALAGAAVHGVVEPLLYIPRITVTFWLVVGLVLCAGKVVLGQGGLRPNDPEGEQGVG